MCESVMLTLYAANMWHTSLLWLSPDFLLRICIRLKIQFQEFVTPHSVELYIPSSVAFIQEHGLHILVFIDELQEAILFR
jgi:hypothetical protein